MPTTVKGGFRQTERGRTLVNTFAHWLAEKLPIRDPMKCAMNVLVEVEFNPEIFLATRAIGQKITQSKAVQWFPLGKNERYKDSYSYYLGPRWDIEERYD